MLPQLCAGLVRGDGLQTPAHQGFHSSERSCVLFLLEKKDDL